MACGETGGGVCIGFTWQGFGSGRAAGVASVRRHQELPPCLSELVPGVVREAHC